jgi:SAM-dependent methyltransferase
LSEGKEQKVFSSDTTPPTLRSEKLVLRLLQEVGRGARWLDFGAGDGTLLSTIAHHDASAHLEAFDVSDHNKDEVEARCDLKKFHSNLAEIETGFDVIVLSHVLEHLQDPIEEALQLSHLLKTQGLIAIQVPNLEKNPFDMLVFDHVSHFTPRTLEIFASRLTSSFEINVDLYPKEIVALLTFAEQKLRAPHDVLPTSNHGRVLPVHEVVLRLDAAAASALTAKQSASTLGVFGTSTAAVWCAELFDGSFDFWVDEDESRIGKAFMGLPVVAPDSIPARSLVVVPFVETLASRLANRLISESSGSLLAIV